MIEISNVSLPLDADFSRLTVLKLSVDARKKSNVHFVATLGEEAPNGVNEEGYVRQLQARGKQARIRQPYEPLEIPLLSKAAKVLSEAGGPCCGECRPIVVGSGPAGLFAALYLARAGLRPLVVERGACVEKRVGIVDAFNNGAPLDLQTNIQFGEGGAGTFSDGKLTTNIKNPLTKHVLRWFVEAGAPAEIEVLAKPHIGTDVLRGVIRNMRRQVEEAGGSFLFETQLTGMEVDGNGAICGVALNTRNPDAIAQLGADRCESAAEMQADGSAVLHVPAGQVILACGHSARDTFQMVHDAGADMEQKPFSVGVRIEHLQADINRAQYGPAAGHPALGAADYKLAVHLPSGRSVYTFCMCPGGEVVCATSEESAVVVNGMSNHARDGRNANSAVLVGVDPEDFGSDHPLAGTWLQRRIERGAYDAAAAAGGAAYQAPAQRVGDFLGLPGEPSKAGEAPRVMHGEEVKLEEGGLPEPTYARGVAYCDLHDCLPDFVCKALEEALPLLDKKLHGFANPQAVMTGVETRSSSPVRIVRGAHCESNIRGLYPCGEGAGYAGGIMSAAADGLRVAQELARQMQVRVAAIALQGGAAVILPTDTVYGLAVLPSAAQSPALLYELKGRPSDKPVAWLVPDAQALDRYGRDVPEYARELARKHWPGALTLVVRASNEVPEAYASNEGTIGLRMPKSPVALEVMRLTGGALATTSANLSGQPATAKFSDLPQSLLSQVALAVEADPRTSSGVASTVVDCTGSKPVVLRQGDILVP